MKIMRWTYCCNY